MRFAYRFIAFLAWCWMKLAHGLTTDGNGKRVPATLELATSLALRCDELAKVGD